MAIQADRNMLFELLHKDHYSAEELSRVLGMDIHLILHEAQCGKLKAYIVDHHVLDIGRHEVIDWLQHRDGR